MFGGVAVAGGALVDVPFDGVWSVLVLQCPNVLGQFRFGCVFPMLE